MPLDGLTLGFAADGLRAALVNGRIDRIVQPERDELNLTIRNNGQNHLLLLSASADCQTDLSKTFALDTPFFAARAAAASRTGGCAASRT